MTGSFWSGRPNIAVGTHKFQTSIKHRQVTLFKFWKISSCLHIFTGLKMFFTKKCFCTMTGSFWSGSPNIAVGMHESQTSIKSKNVFVQWPGHFDLAGRISLLVRTKTKLLSSTKVILIWGDLGGQTLWARDVRHLRWSYRSWWLSFKAMPQHADNKAKNWQALAGTGSFGRTEFCA